MASIRGNRWIVNVGVHSVRIEGSRRRGCGIVISSTKAGEDHAGVLCAVVRQPGGLGNVGNPVDGTTNTRMSVDAKRKRVDERLADTDHGPSGEPKIATEAMAKRGPAAAAATPFGRRRASARPR